MQILLIGLDSSGRIFPRTKNTMSTGTRVMERIDAKAIEKDFV
jgi:hypothetical protein